jgi:SAM-dependent methyltransferase
VADQHDPVDLEAILAQLRERVAARRSAGEYPEALEAKLSEHFARIMAHRKQEPPPTDTYLQELVGQLDERSDFGLHHVRYASDVPGGEKLHRTIGKVVARQNASVLEQLQHYTNLINELLRTLVHIVEAPPRHFHEDLWQQIDGLLERSADAERMQAGGPAALAALADRVAALEGSAGLSPFDPWYSNEAFEAAFRGSRSELLERYGSLADRLAGCDPVLDIGCGRGELLELLQDRGVEASGIETDQELVAFCTARGLDVRHGDGLAALREAQPASLGGVTLIQVIEHLTSQQAVDLVALTAERVRPGGRVVIETVNPQSLYVYAHAFYLDPTHVRPVHPAWLTFLFKEAGFAEVTVDWRSPPPEDEALETGGSEAHDANVARLNELLFAAQDYAVIATR